MYQLTEQQLNVMLPKISVSYRETDLPGMKIYHGTTLDSVEKSMDD